MFEGMNLKDWLEIAGMFLAIGGVIHSVRQLQRDMIDIKVDLKKLNEVQSQMALNKHDQTTFQAATNATIAELRADMRELKHGDGFIGEPFVRTRENTSARHG